MIPEYTDYYPWEGLSEDKKDSLDLEMAVYAAMIDRMDQNIGRVLEKLENAGELENTVIMFLVDNGACPFYSNKIPNVPPGPDSSYWCLRSTWANLCNTPYRQYKQTGYKGGSLTPFIVSWPGVIEEGSISNEPAHVVDIMPTFLDILGETYPDSIEGFASLPLHGHSLIPVFETGHREDPGYFLSGLDKFRSYTQGKYKIVRMNGEEWSLYDLSGDPSEIMDIAEEYPEITDSLIRAYQSHPVY